MFRPPPAVVTFAGAPGIGKSYLVASFCSKLIKALGIPMDSLFSRNIYTEHWDGYYNQPIVVYDDVHCDSLHPSSTTFRELISLISCMPFSPSYAKLENKGDLISPKFVVMSTNFPYPRYQCSEDAIQRRSGMLVYCVPKDNMHFSVDFSHLHLFALSSPLEIKSVHNPHDEYHFTSMASFRNHPGFHSARHVTLDDIVVEIISKYERDKEALLAITAR